MSGISLGCGNRNNGAHLWPNTNRDLQFWLTWVLASEITDTGVEQVPPHSAKLVQQMAARDVVRIPEALRLQALVSRDRWRLGTTKWTQQGGCTNYIKHLITLQEGRTEAEPTLPCWAAPGGSPGTLWGWAPWAEKASLLKDSAAAGWSPCAGPERSLPPANAPWCRPLVEASYQSRRSGDRTRFLTGKINS